MKQAQGSGKRIVSKMEYAALVSRREALRWGSAGLAVVTAMLILCATGFLIAAGVADAPLWKFAYLAGAVVCVAAVCKVKQTAENAMQEALKRLDAVPLTRANVADLPAPDSLVRASAEPVQAQETVLLRAATDTQEKHEEQLLRAAVGEQE